MLNEFKTRKEILHMRRSGVSLFDIYQTLEKSKPFLEFEKKGSFELLHEVLLQPLQDKDAQELIAFPTEDLELFCSHLTPSQAKIFSQFAGFFLKFHKLIELDVATLKALSHSKSYLELKLLRVGEKEAKLLSQFKNILFLEIQNINEETAKALSKIEFIKSLGFFLKILGEIEESAAKSISQFKGNKIDFGLQELNEGIASILIEFRGKILSFSGLKGLSKNVAEILLRFKGKSLFLGVEKIDEETAKVLALFRGSVMSEQKWMERTRNGNLYLLGILVNHEEIAKQILCYRRK